MKIFMYDFEVYKHFWMVEIINYETREKLTILNNSQQLKDFYNKHKNDILVGYNSRGYDQFIFQAILFDIDPYYVSEQIVNYNKKGYKIIKNMNEYPLNNFDISTGFHSLKQLEAFMGSRIKETDVDFDLDRPLTDKEIKQVVEYCIHDVEQTIEVFDNRKEEFDSQLALIKAFNLPMKMFNKTKAQLSAHVLGAVRQERLDDEFNMSIPDTLVVSDKYKYIVDWYKNPLNMSYSKSLETMVAGVPHVFAYGGIHGAIKNYSGEGIILCCDVASLYPSIMIEYNYISRNVTNPSKYKEIRDTRLKLKAEKNPMQLPYKIVLNSTYGAMKDQYNPLYDPLMANNVCIAGQLLLLDLIEKVEPYCELIQSNTDGVFMKVENMETVEKIKEIAKEWEQRTRLDLEWDIFSKIYQKDVNNYIIIDDKGKYKSKGAYVKKLSNIDYDLPIINKALIDYFTKDKPLEETINESNDLREFQKVVKVSSLYKYAIHNGEKLPEKVLRVFASNDDSDGAIYKLKGKDKLEKMANTPDNCFIENDYVKGVIPPEKLDKKYYIDLAKKRLNDFLHEKEKLTKVEKTKKLIHSFDPVIHRNDSFYGLLEENKTMKLCTTGELEILIKLDVFKKYGLSLKLLNYLYYFNLLYGKKSPKKQNLSTKIDDQSILKVIENNCEEHETSFKNMNYEIILKDIFTLIPNEDVLFVEKINLQLEYLNEINYVNHNLTTDYLYVVNLNNALNTTITAYCMNNGKAKQLIIPREIFKILPCQTGDVIRAKGYERRPRKKLVGRTNEGINIYDDDETQFDFWLTSYEIAYR